MRREKKAIFVVGWNGGFMAMEGRERGRGEEDTVTADSMHGQEQETGA